MRLSKLIVPYVVPLSGYEFQPLDVSISHSQFDAVQGTATRAFGCDTVDIADSTFTGIGLDIRRCDGRLEAVTISDVEVALRAVESSISYRGRFSGIGSHAIEACNWKTEDCAVDATHVDWGSAAGPFPEGADPLVCGQVLTDPWIGQSNDVGSNVWRSPNCDGSTYDPGKEMSDASSYAADRNAEVFALCDPDDPTLADACEVYERFQACYASALQLAKAGSTFPIPATESEWAEGGVSAIATGLTEGSPGTVTDIAQGIGIVGSILKVVGINTALKDAYYNCAGG